ncbi:helix-turn-helix transcriptional regulator [bacterium]|nr:helix-turn-helix transcriptional regulator [bacterium]
MGIKQELGRQIKKLRIARGYTQEKLSEMADISQRALSSIEIGENFVTAETLDKLLIALDITTEELFATNASKNSDELLKMINRNIAEIGDAPEKLEIIYNLTKSLKRK